MAKDDVRELKLRGPDSEKITINLGFVDLGQIDLLRGFSDACHDEFEEMRQTQF